MKTVFVLAVVLSSLVAAGGMTPVLANHQAAALIEPAQSAELQEPASNGIVPEQESDPLREGGYGRARLPPPAHLHENPPMCRDGAWMLRMDAYLRLEAGAGASVGVCYMLARDEGAGCTDRYAEGCPGS